MVLMRGEFFEAFGCYEVGTIDFERFDWARLLLIEDPFSQNCFAALRGDVRVLL